jgi:ATP-binding cassette subfamily B protein
MVALIIIISAIKNQLNRIIQEKSARDLQFSVFDQLRNLGFSYYEKHSVGETLSLFNNEITKKYMTVYHRCWS